MRFCIHTQVAIESGLGFPNVRSALAAVTHIVQSHNYEKDKWVFKSLCTTVRRSYRSGYLTRFSHGAQPPASGSSTGKLV